MTSLTFRCKSVSQWNALPTNLRTELQMKKFKINLKRWLRERDKNEDKRTNDESQEDMDNSDATSGLATRTTT